MTFAPDTLTDLAAYWVSKGGINLGIVGDGSHVNKGVSYHLGKSALKPGAYSAQLPRDVAGLSEAASAIDLGKLNGSLSALQEFSVWLVQQCIDYKPGTADIREIIYSPDGNLPIHRWSGPEHMIYTGSGQGDASHKTHSHISYYRDAENRDKIAVFAPYFDGGGVAYTYRTLAKGGTAKNQGGFDYWDFATGAKLGHVDAGDGDKETVSHVQRSDGNIGSLTLTYDFILDSQAPWVAPAAPPPVQPGTGVNEAAIRKDQLARDRRELLPDRLAEEGT